MLSALHVPASCLLSTLLSLQVVCCPLYCPSKLFVVHFTVPASCLLSTLLSQQVVCCPLYCPSKLFVVRFTVPASCLLSALLSQQVVCCPLYCPSKLFVVRFTVPASCLLSALLSQQVVCCPLYCPSNTQNVPQEQICSDKYARYHSEIEVAYQTCYLTQSEYADAGLTNPTTDPMILGAWQSSH